MTTRVEILYPRMELKTPAWDRRSARQEAARRERRERRQWTLLGAALVAAAFSMGALPAEDFPTLGVLRAVSIVAGLAVALYGWLKK